MPFLGLGRPDTSACHIPNVFHELSENKMSYHSVVHLSIRKPCCRGANLFLQWVPTRSLSSFVG